MLTSDRMRNLSGPAIYGAGEVEGRTARAWIGANGLKLGDREGRERGHPRYDLADAARLKLMRVLMERGGMRAQVAVDLTNAAWAHIALLSEDELAAIDNPAEPTVGKRYVMVLDRVDGLHKPTILPHDDPWISNGKRGQWFEARVDLREVVRSARDQLASFVGVPFHSMRHDFADAPEPVGNGDLRIGAA